MQLLQQSAFASWWPGTADADDGPGSAAAFKAAGANECANFLDPPTLSLEDFALSAATSSTARTQQEAMQPDQDVEWESLQWPDGSM